MLKEKPKGEEDLQKALRVSFLERNSKILYRRLHRTGNLCDDQPEKRKS
jgi:hypothetical protein